jgi:spore germination protein GerM
LGEDMIRKKALRKIFITTLTMFIILTIYSIPTTSINNNVLRTNLEINNTNLSNTNIYLLNNDNLLVKTNIYISFNSLEEKITNIINYLTINNSKISSNLSGYIPIDTKINSIEVRNDILYLDLSSNFLNSSNKDIMITGLVYTLLEIDQFTSINLTVNGDYITGFNKVLNKDIGINKEYLYSNRNNISKVIVYYYDDIINYNLVPVTKYLNDDREEIEIIIDELKNTDNYNIISLINYNTKLLNYYEESNVMFLNFNDYLLDSNSNINEKIFNTIAYSVFSNYDVNMVMFLVNGTNIEYIIK